MPPPPSIKDLILLDAMGEISPEQTAQLAAALEADPALAAESTALKQVVHQLNMHSPTAIPAIPAHVLTRARTASTPPSRSWWRSSMAVAAILVCSLSAWWMFRPAPAGFPETASTTKSLPPVEMLPMGVPVPVVTETKGTGTRRALLVAVEPWPDKEKDPERGAGWRDLQMMREVLTKKWGFAEANIHQLFNKKATTRNAIQALEKLVTETKPADSVVIYWTSHGTQVADTNGDEPDGLDEAYCTFDYDWSEPETWFTDDLLGALLDRIPTKDILVITDACHSGGSTRGDGDSDTLPKAISSGFVPAATLNPRAIPIKAPSHVMHLAACASDEVSYGSYGKGGYFTIQLHQAFLNQSPDSLNFQQAVEKVRSKLSALFKGFTLKPDSPKTWTPQFEGPVTKKIATFLNPSPPEPTTIPPNPPPAPPLPIWQKQSGDILLNLSTDKQIYTEGDLMQVTATPDLDCHLRLYYLSADHKVNQIFPNKFQADDLVKKGQTITLPGAGGNFDFKMSAPFGNEILMAVASSVPFTDQAEQEVQTQLFQEFKDTNLDALAHRGISVEEKQTLTGRALHLYRVEAKK